MADIKVHVKYDSSEYKKNVEDYINKLSDNIDDALRDAANWFASAAARHTPPNIGKNTIPNNLYYRPIVKLKELVASGNASPIDVAQFKSGKRFKVINTKKGKDVPFAYTKTNAEARKAARIANRGLARVMWGKSLPSVGAKIPVTILRLMSRSEHLNTLNYSETTLDRNGDVYDLQIENKAKNVEKFGKNAERFGSENAEKRLVKWIRDFSMENTKL